MRFRGLICGFSLLWVTPAAGQTPIREFLNDIRTQAAETQRENEEKLERFSSEPLSRARAMVMGQREVDELTARRDAVQRKFDFNANRIDDLEAEHQAEVLGFLTSIGLNEARLSDWAGHFRESMISSEYPNRADVFERMRLADPLPRSEDLEEIIAILLGEIQAQREVSRFEAGVWHGNFYNSVSRDIIRIGPFMLFTTKGKFVRYDSEALVPLAVSRRIPVASEFKAISNTSRAKPGDIVFAPVDPTGGYFIKTKPRR